MKAMFTGLATAILYVRDIEKSKRFYVDILGFTIDDDEGLYVSMKASMSSQSKVALNAMNKVGQFPGHQTIILGTKNIKQAYDLLKSQGINFSLPLTTKPWGETFIFSDPDGNNIEVLQ